MSDATDDLEMLPYHVRDIDGTFYTFNYKGKKYSFRTIEKANEWAKSKGLRLGTAPPQPIKKRD